MKNLDRRAFLGLAPVVLVACSAAAEQSSPSARTAESPTPPEEFELVVHKTPSCGCCAAWVEHMQANGFETRVIEADDTGPVAARLGVPDELRSCHTAEIAGYAVEGHVPADAVRRLLDERPDGAGLAVPGMPLGSPGMEMGDRRENYDVILFDRSGDTQVFVSY